MNDGAGQFPVINEVDAGFGSGGGTIVVTTGDFNNDTFRDLAVSHWKTSKVTVHLGNGDGTFQPDPTVLEIGASGVPGSLGVGDFDQDTKEDLVVARRGISDPVSVFWGNGDGTFSTPLNLIPPCYARDLCGFGHDAAKELSHTPRQSIRLP